MPPSLATYTNHLLAICNSAGDSRPGSTEATHRHDHWAQRKYCLPASSVQTAMTMRHGRALAYTSSFEHQWARQAIKLVMKPSIDTHPANDLINSVPVVGATFVHGFGCALENIASTPTLLKLVKTVFAVFISRMYNEARRHEYIT